MRVTQGMFYTANNRRLQDGLSRIYRSQNEIASGKRITTPSDDADGVRRLLDLRRRLSQLEQFETNAFQSRSFVESASGALQSISDSSISSREAIVQAKGATLETSRETIARTLTGHLEDIVALANSRVAGRFLFAGTATDREPFELRTDAEGRQHVVYHGNRETITSEIGPNVLTAVNVTGAEVFPSGKRGKTVYEGFTGAKAGVGTDTAVGVKRLQVEHLATTYAAAGLLPGTISAQRDTALGGPTMNDLQLEVDASGQGTITLNGGDPIAFDGTETDLEVTGPDGEALFVDVTALAAPFSGPVPFTATATASIDGGRSVVTIDWSGSQTLTDALDGAIVHVDTSGIRRAGEESLIFRGSMDIFSSIIAVRDELLRVGANGDAAGDLDRVEQLLAEFDEAFVDLTDAMGRLGTLGSRLESAENRVADLQVEVRGLVSDVEDVDVAEAITRLQQEENSYQSALLLTSRLSQLSLLNFL